MVHFLHFTLEAGIYGGIGFVIGAFTPAIGRTIKAWFVAETAAAVAAVKSAATKV